MKHVTRSTILLGLLWTVGCRTLPLPAPYTLPVPMGLTAQQIEVAVLAGILNMRPPREYDPTKELPREEFDRLIWLRFVGTARSRGWFPESREGETIYAAVYRREHYLRAAIEPQGRNLRIRIVESRNLKQNGRRIHKRAVKWLRNLEAHIRRELGRMSVLAQSAHLRQAADLPPP